jgi:hypothetical protein
VQNAQVTGEPDLEEVYAAYGRVMHRAQYVIELSLRHLYALFDETLDDAGSVEKAWKKIRAQRAGLDNLRAAGLSPDLLGRVKEAIATRNTLAHDYFVHPLRASALADGQPRAALLADLRDAETRYARLAQELDAIADQRTREIGITPEEEAEAEKIALRLLDHAVDGDTRD